MPTVPATDAPPTNRGTPRKQSGQSLIESCLVIAITALVFMGLLQLSQIIAAREVLDHAAARGARSKTVGFNRWMVRKVVRVAAIPNAGRMVEPTFENENAWLRNRVATRNPGDLWSDVLAISPESQQAGIERGRIPDYLGSENSARAHYILDYEDWDDVGHSASDGETVPGGDPSTDRLLRFQTRQRYRLWVPWHRAFYADSHIDLTGEALIENHYPLYLADLDW